MIRSLYTAITGLITQEAREDVITNNMANADTNGFKSDNLSIGSFKNVLLQNYAKTVGDNYERTILGNVSLGSEIDSTNTLFTQGQLQPEDSNTDFAINGRGFFSVLRDNGVDPQKIYYTRDGEFHVNGDGYLVDNSGDFVLAKGGGKIQVGSDAISSDDYGNISAGGRNYQFDTVDFADYNKLQKVGDNLYDGANPIQNAQMQVKQKYLEKSNVNVVKEMVNMISTMRTFETNQKIVQSIDETLNKTANDVGKVG